MTEDRWAEERLVQDLTEEIISPSDRYRLVIRYYDQGEKYWNYSRGTVYRISDGVEIADVKRNYSTFHHSFVVKNGEEYLISGRSYMGQTIVNLDTGVELNDSQWKGEGYKGYEFCWADSYLSPDGNTLAVHGCTWGAPYEFRFYDFTDPTTRGWPEIEIIGRNGEPASLDANKRPTFQGDTIICTETVRVFKPTGQCEDVLDQLPDTIEDTLYDDEDNWMDVPDFITTLRRSPGTNQIHIVDRWESAKLKAERAQAAQLRQEKMATIRETTRYKRASALAERLTPEIPLNQIVYWNIWNNWEILFAWPSKEPGKKIGLAWAEGESPIEVTTFDPIKRNEFPNDDKGFDAALQVVEAVLSRSNVDE